jgi:CheY-like chemotaxis protein
VEIINESPEHHFVAILDKCKLTPQNWVCLYFSMQRGLNHAYIIKNIKNITDTLDKMEAQSRRFFDLACAEIADISGGYAYRFGDGDIVLLMQACNEDNKTKIRKIYNTLSEKIESSFSDYSLLEQDFYNYQKLADSKLISEKRLQAYRELGNKNKVASIGARRKRRADPLVMVVEDDRFTSAYATSILNKVFDVTQAKSGEDAIIQYIETAPDIVLLDIHLPGLNGHQTLQTLQAIDPQAFVVILSVDTSQQNVLNATNAGAHTFLKKPFSRERLVATVRKSPHIRMREIYIQDTVGA